MDVREKMVELIIDAKRTDQETGSFTEYLADHLIRNGVTVQEWISVYDKYPPYNRDVLVYRPNMAMKIVVDTYDGYYGDDDDEWYEGWALYGKDTHGNPAITHWSYLPKPPKGE